MMRYGPGGYDGVMTRSKRILQALADFEAEALVAAASALMTSAAMEAASSSAAMEAASSKLFGPGGAAAMPARDGPNESGATPPEKAE